jgi:hypothetical protein
MPPYLRQQVLLRALRLVPDTLVGSAREPSSLFGAFEPIRTWLMAFAILRSAKKGVSALQLQRQLGLVHTARLGICAIASATPWLKSHSLVS